jgi:hypothetical protein
MPFRRFQENQVGLKLNGTHHLLEDNIDSIKKNTETLTDAGK